MVVVMSCTLLCLLLDLLLWCVAATQAKMSPSDLLAARYYNKVAVCVVYVSRCVLCVVG